MTWATAWAVAKRVGGWLAGHRELALAGALVIAVVFATCSLRRAVIAEAAIRAAAARQVSEAKIEGAGIPVLKPAPQPVVDDATKKLLDSVPELKAARDRLEKEVGHLRAVAVLQAKTASTPATGKERPGEVVAPGPAIEPVLLRVRDKLHLELAGAELEDKAGAKALLVAADVARDLDGEILHRGTLSVPLTTALTSGACPAAEVERRWRAGPMGGGSGQGWLAGVGGTYRLDVLGYRPEVAVTAAGGPQTGLILAGFFF